MYYALCCECRHILAFPYISFFIANGKAKDNISTLFFLILMQKSTSKYTNKHIFCCLEWKSSYILAKGHIYTHHHKRTVKRRKTQAHTHTRNPIRSNRINSVLLFHFVKVFFVFNKILYVFFIL